MPLTDEPRSKYHALQIGEQWFVCSACGSILGKLRSDGVLELKVGGEVISVDPQHRAAIQVDCTCRQLNDLLLMKGKEVINKWQEDQPRDCTARRA